MVVDVQTVSTKTILYTQQHHGRQCRTHRGDLVEL